MVSLSLSHHQKAYRITVGEAKKLYYSWLKEYCKDGKLEFHRAKGCGTCG